MAVLNFVSIFDTIALHVMTDFPHKVCLNLDRRHDRWERVERRFAHSGIGRVERFSAIDGRAADPPSTWRGSAGAFGCLASHLAVVRKARHAGWPSVLIFEDDVVFAPDAGTHLGQVTDRMPDGWHMFSLGGLHQQAPVPVADGLVRATALCSTHAYVVRHTLYDAFIALNEKAERPVDLNNVLLQQEYDCYCAMPHLAWQEAGFSDVRECEQNFWMIRESLTSGRGERDRMLRSTAVVLAHHAGARADVLRFVAKHYAESTPEADLVVVETGRRPALKTGMLPAGCDYRFVPSREPEAARQDAFDAGYRATRAESVVFADGDCLPPRPRDLICGIQVSQRHDMVGFYEELVTFGPATTRRVLAEMSLESAHLEAENRRGEPLPITGSACLLKRADLDVHGGWTGAVAALGDTGVFRCPVRGVRLDGG